MLTYTQKLHNKPKCSDVLVTEDSLKLKMLKCQILAREEIYHLLYSLERIFVLMVAVVNLFTE